MKNGSNEFKNGYISLAMLYKSYMNVLTDMFPQHIRDVTPIHHQNHTKIKFIMQTSSHKNDHVFSFWYEIAEDKL